MTADPRAKFVNIPGLKMEEALHLLQPYAQGLRAHGMLTKDVVDQIGGHPAWLIYVGNSSSPQGEIDRLLSEARDEVKCCLHAHPEYTEPLRHLVLKGYEGGALTEEFNDIARKKQWWWAASSNKTKPSSELSDVISVSQKYRVVHKNLQSGKVVFHTLLHYRAAKEVLKC
jgi:hypothetical protein